MNDPDKKSQYDRFGTDPDSRQASSFGNSASGRHYGFERFEGELSPEDLFNLFFNGMAQGNGGKRISVVQGVINQDRLPIDDVWARRPLFESWGKCIPAATTNSCTAANRAIGAAQVSPDSAAVASPLLLSVFVSFFQFVCAGNLVLTLAHLPKLTAKSDRIQTSRLLDESLAELEIRLGIQTKELGKRN